MKKLHAQKRCWKPYGRTSLCWSLNYINDNAKVDLKNIKMMYCILCFQTSVCGINYSNEERIDFLLQDLWNNIFF